MDFGKIFAKGLRRGRKLYRAIDKVVEQFEEMQWLDSNSLVTYQEENLKKLFVHCWEKNPYYRHLFERNGFSMAENIGFNRMPLLEKSDIRNSFDVLKSSDISRRNWFATKSGGSTGEPITVIQDEYYRIQSEAKKTVCFQWAGYNIGELKVMLWGSERDILQGGSGWKGRLSSLVHRRIILNAFLLTPDNMREYIRVINRLSPAFIHTYAHVIYELSRFVKKHGIKVNPPKMIVSTSGSLHGFMRSEIEDAFGCQVFNQYGSRELSCIASECNSHQGLHINMETLVLEILDEQGQPCPPGVEGEIVVTSLVNYSMPLVRYRIGDRGIFSGKSCGCGRGLTLLQQVTGRSMDCFRRSDGSIVPGEYFIHFLGVVFNQGWIERVQIIQETYDYFLIRVVSSDMEGRRSKVIELEKIVRLVMGEQCKIDVQFEDTILPTDSGKYRYTVCNLTETVS